MFDDLYYFGLNFFEQNGLYLIAGLILTCSGFLILHKRQKTSNVGIGLILIGIIILLCNGVFTLLYLLFFVALGIVGGFLLYAFTKE